MPTFAVPQNNVSTTVGGTGYVAGSGSLTLVPGGGAAFPSLGAGQFLRVTVIQAAFARLPSASPATYTIFNVTGLSGDVLTIAGTLEGTLDRSYAAGDVVEMRVTAGTIRDVQTPFSPSGPTHSPGMVPDPGSTTGQSAYLREDATFQDPLIIADGHDVVLGSSTGSRIGTATTQKQAFYGATPIVRPAGDVLTALGNLGLVGSPGLVSPAITGTPTAPTAPATTNTTQLATTAFVQTAIQFGHGICNGRLTLLSGNPLVASASGATLYFTPFQGNYVGLYDGVGTWNLLTFTEQSIPVPAPTGLYDVFAYNNSGTLALELGNIWTATGNNTAAAGTRSQGIVLQDGIYVKSGATTRRYLGTIYASSGTAFDTPTLRGTWNYYNRIPKKVVSYAPAVNWNYTVNGVWRPLGGSTTTYVAVLSGVSESTITLKAAVNVQAPDGNNSGTVGIGYDTPSANTADLNGITGFVAAFRDTSWASLEHLTQAGLHTYYAVEEVINVGGAIAMNFFSNGQSTHTSSGISGTFWC